jgi:hypothetical protein
MDEVVESYMKRQHAWEQLTSVVPREIRDAIEFFALLESQCCVCLHRMQTEMSNRDLPDEDFYKLRGLIVLSHDLLRLTENSHSQCAMTWSLITKMVSDSPIVAEVTGGCCSTLVSYREHSAFHIASSAQFIPAEFNPLESHLQRTYCSLEPSTEHMDGDSSAIETETG